MGRKPMIRPSVGKMSIKTTGDVSPHHGRHMTTLSKPISPINKFPDSESDIGDEAVMVIKSGEIGEVDSDMASPGAANVLSDDGMNSQELMNMKEFNSI